MENTDRVAVVLMAKAPRAGAVKTRLSPPLGATETAELACCFLFDTLDAVRAIAGTTPVVAYTPESERGFFATTGTILVPQRGHDLGSRIAAAFDDVIARGFPAAVALGTDAPTLPPDCLERAVAVLTDARVDAVIGPTEDGGYYLLGRRAPRPELFDGTAWSTARVFRQTSRAAWLGLRVATLPGWYDTDTPADLERLSLEIERGADAPGTRAELAVLRQRWAREHGAGLL